MKNKLNSLIALTLKASCGPVEETNNDIDQEDFYLYSQNTRGRFVTFGISYGFGKGEAMSYSGWRRG